MNKLAPVIALVVLCAIVFVIFSGDENRSVDVDISQPTAGSTAPATIEERDVDAAPVIDRALASADEQTSYSGQQGLEHVIGEAAFVTFTVVDADGALLPECFVSPESSSRVSQQGMFAQAPAADREDYILSSDASITLAVSSNREAYFSIHHPQWQEYLFTCQAPASGEVRDLGKIVLNPASMISGVISDHRGQPVSNATVSASSTTNQFGMDVLKDSTTTDQQGAFVLGGLQADEYKILAQAPSFSSTEMTVSIKKVPVTKTISIQLEGGAKISGRVLATDGSPIANAEIVQILASNRIRFMRERDGMKGETVATTDNGGNYVATVGIANGVANIGARHPDYKDTKIEVADNYSAADITMQPSLHLYGSFANTSGLDTKTARINLNKKTEGAGRRERLLARNNQIDGKVNSDGSFKFNDITAGVYTLSVDTNLGNLKVENLAISASIDGYIAELPLIPRLNYHVVDDAGQPIDDVNIRLDSQAQTNSGATDMFVMGNLDGNFVMPGGSTSYHGRTNGDGNCVIGGMPQGKYSLRITHPDYAKTVEEINVWQDSEDIEIVLAPAAGLTVNTLNPAQQAVANIKIKLMQGDKKIATAITNDFGAANFAGLSGGEYILLFDADDSQTGMIRMISNEQDEQPATDGKLGRTTTQLTPGERQVVDWQIAGLCDLTVQVRKDGRPAEGIIVSAKEELSAESGNMFFGGFGEEANAAVHTDSQGIALLSNRLAGEYILKLKVNKNSFATEQKITLYQGANNVSVDLSVNHISGTLIDSSGKAIAAHELSLIKVSDEGSTNTATAMISFGIGGSTRTINSGEGLAIATSGSDGRFNFENIPDGNWQVIARHPEFITAKSETFSLSSGTSLDIGMLEFKIGGSISGVNNRHKESQDGGFGQWIRENYVRLRRVDENGNTIDQKSAQSRGARGEFSFEQLAEGDYIIRCGDFRSETIHLRRGEALNFDIPAEK